MILGLCGGCGFDGGLEEILQGGDVGEENGGEVVAMLEVVGGVGGEPDLAGGVLPSEGFEGEVDGGGGGGEHDGGASFGVAEEEELGGRHGEAVGGGVFGEINSGEEGEAFGVGERREAVEGFGDGVGAGEVEHAGGLWGHGRLLLFVRDDVNGHGCTRYGHRSCYRTTGNCQREMGRFARFLK